MFHLHRYSKQPVRIFQVDGGTAREVLYDSELFLYGDNPAVANLPPDLGFAGFRALERDGVRDWLSFQGASYFRSSGELAQYGTSARGIAINTVGPTPEEFPQFTQFWIEQPADRPHTIVVHALLDGPSIAGAYRIAIEHGRAIVMDIDAALYPRSDIADLGVAPLTSMFWHSKAARLYEVVDWRPEVHDVDGLALLTGSGERIWRPINNPVSLQISSFSDRNPRGFGLLQRDRNFDNYEDDGANYHKRPSVWIEPKGDWGEGVVKLVEIPTDDETHDNIVAYWLPKEPVRAGSEHAYSYRLTWAADQPDQPPIGRAIATRVGLGGIPGLGQPPDQRKFVIDFAGGPLDQLIKADAVDTVVTASRGRVTKSGSFQVVDTKLWRAYFDLEVSDGLPIDLRLFLSRHGAALSETWLYQYLPNADPIRDALQSGMVTVPQHQD
jgi:glucans biosynthesis protein